MDTGNKNKQQETQRTVPWMRIGIVALTMLGPAINALTERMRARAEALRQAAELLERQRLELEEEQEGEVTEKRSLGGDLLALKERPYAQAVLKRGGDLAQDLRERGSRFSQALVEQSSKVSQDLIDRSSEATQDLLKRGSKVSREVTKRSKKTARELSRRRDKAARDLAKRRAQLTRELDKRRKKISHDLAERDSRVWTIAGFAVGLIAATFAAYLFMRKRFMDQQEDQETHFLLSRDGHRTSAPTGQPGTVPKAQAAAGAPRQAPAIAVAEQSATTPMEQSVPANATLFGVVSTRLYYPVGTPLDQLTRPEGRPSDIIYFSTEEEAKKQGFSPGP